jgi:hypothetical protein
MLINKIIDATKRRMRSKISDSVTKNNNVLH